MLFQAKATFVNGVVGIDPVAAPQDVPADALLRLPMNPHSTDAPPSCTRVVLDAPVAETLTVDVWAMDDSIEQRISNADNPTPLLAERRFYLLQSALVLTGKTIVALNTGRGGFLGTLFLRRTADALTTTRAVLASVL